MMFLWMILDETVGRARPYEIVVAILIVIISAVSLVFLYRNVMKNIRDQQKEKRAVGKDDSDKDSKKGLKLFGRNQVYDNPDVRGKINENILKTDEGELRTLYSIDIDDFRTIVEKYDQKTLDKITNEIEKRLAKRAGDDDITGHIGKDKFIYFYTGEVNSETITELAEDLLSLMKEPLKVDNIKITASIGICVFPYDGIDADGLIKNADLAVYVAKKEGKSKYNFYSQDMVDKERFNITYYEEIKGAIDRDEFLLYYQPIVDVKTGKIIGLESLLRWNHPEMGILPPGKFLNVMDLTGDITWFGMWGFERVVKKYSEWLKEFRIRQLFISINLSPKQLLIEDLASKFYDLTTKYTMKPDNFTFEVLDYFAINKNDIAMNNLHEFRKYGFRVAVDDRGQDFELIDHLPDIDANMYKIQRSDVLKVMDDDPITEKVKKLVEVAKENHKIVIAEGIEEPDMIRKMSEWNIRFMQGYFFSEPVDVDKAKELIKNNPWNLDSFDEYTN